MKKLTVIVVLLVSFLGWGVSAECAEKIYVSVSGGVVYVDDSDATAEDINLDGEFSADQGYVVAAAIGNKYKTGVRTEFEIAYRDNDIDEVKVEGVKLNDVDGSASALSFMVNAFYDFMPTYVVSPFVGAGAGYASIKGDLDYLESGSASVFAYQAAAGISINVHKNASIDVQYRYFATTDPEFDDIEAEYSTHNALLGLRYTF